MCPNVECYWFSSLTNAMNVPKYFLLKFKGFMMDTSLLLAGEGL